MKIKMRKMIMNSRFIASASNVICKQNGFFCLCSSTDANKYNNNRNPISIYEMLSMHSATYKNRMQCIKYDIIYNLVYDFYHHHWEKYQEISTET